MVNGNFTFILITKAVISVDKRCNSIINGALLKAVGKGGNTIIRMVGLVKVKGRYILPCSIICAYKGAPAGVECELLRVGTLVFGKGLRGCAYRAAVGTAVREGGAV